MILLYLTLIVVALVVLALAAYLIGIAFYLWRANQHLAQLVEHLQVTRQNADPLPANLTTINQALVELRDHLKATDRNLAGAARVLERE